MFFDSWSGLARVLISAALAYIALVVFLRISGNRTLSKLSAFDLVVTVALGSTLATIILSKDVAITEGVLALATLIALQFAISWSSVRWGIVGRAVKSEPTIVVRDGQMLADQMRRARLLQSDIESAVRQQGHTRLDHVTAIVLESDGSLSVIPLSARPTSDRVENAGNQSAPADALPFIPSPRN